MTETDEQRRLRELEARISVARGKTEPEPPKPDHHGLANHAWRMVTELVAGLLIGLGIGLGLDWLFDSRPLFLVLFVLAGLAAGVNVMLRTAREIQPKEDIASEVTDEQRGKDRG